MGVYNHKFHIGQKVYKVLGNHNSEGEYWQPYGFIIKEINICIRQQYSYKDPEAKPTLKVSYYYKSDSSTNTALCISWCSGESETTIYGTEEEAQVDCDAFNKKYKKTIEVGGSLFGRCDF